MNCTACPFQKQIDALRERCLACNPDSTGGTPHGNGRVKADDYTLNSVPKAVDYSIAPSGQATHLDAEDEQKLRMAMTDLFGLDPVDLLLLQHIIHGGALSTFGQTLDRVKGAKIYTRQAALYHKRKILDAFPTIRSVITCTGDGDVEQLMMGGDDD